MSQCDPYESIVDGQLRRHREKVREQRASHVSEDPAYSRSNRESALQRAIRATRPEHKHVAIQYTMTVVVPDDYLTPEQAAKLTTRMRDLGNNAASGVELTMDVEGAPVTVTGSLTTKPA